MSRIFEALKNAQAARNKLATVKNESQGATEVPDRRGSRRLAIDVPVYVYGHASNREAFHEEAHTLQVSAKGALLLLGGAVEPGDKLLLTHAISQKEQDCTVVYLGKNHQKSTEVGITFPEENPDFWLIRPDLLKRESAH